MKANKTKFRISSLVATVLSLLLPMAAQVTGSDTVNFVPIAPTDIASTTWYVNGVSGNNSNDCKTPPTACKTIKHAISLASSGDSVLIAAATYTENLIIAFSLTIAGSGAPRTIIDGGGLDRVVIISSATAHVTLSGVTIRNGLSQYGGGIFNTGTLRVVASTVSGNTAFISCHRFCSTSGGGISNPPGATLTISKSTVSGNLARATCTDACASSGGGISNYGSLTVNNSTLNGNNAKYGGGIGNGGSMTVNNSTLNGNKAANNGGGISNEGSLMTVNNSTVAGNFAGFGGSGIDNSNGGTATLQNSIVANNLGTGNCEDALISKGYNLSSDGSCNFNGPGDLNDTNPMLGPLQYNGGPTKTMALPSGSPAIDAGNPSGCTNGLGHLLKTDQRGMRRPDTEDSGGCDIGAFERQSD
jgi:hypothetical protein